MLIECGETGRSAVRPLAKNFDVQAIDICIRSTTPDLSHICIYYTVNKLYRQTVTRYADMSFFRITLTRSAIGLPKKYSGTLRALGLTKRMKTVYLPVNHEIAGQIFQVKELVDVQEVENRISNKVLKELRKPEPGFYIEQRAGEVKQQWG